MNRNQLERANTIDACIRAAERNIECYEILGKAKEIKIEVNDVTSDHCKIFISSEQKRYIIDYLKQEMQRVINRSMAELEKI